VTTVKLSSGLSDFATLTGTPGEIRSRLSSLRSGRVIALTFAHGSEQAVKEIAETMASIAPMVDTIVALRRRKSLESIVDALVPAVAPPKHMMIEARMTAQARKDVLEGAEWLTAAQITGLAGFSQSNPSAQPNKWKKDGLIFAVRHQGTDYFPGYGLDATAGYRPHKALAQILRTFGDAKDAWGLAYWFASVNSFLGGRRPQDLLAQQADRVLAAAHDEMAAIAHG
jgi:hypothetical protein